MIQVADEQIDAKVVKNTKIKMNRIEFFFFFFTQVFFH